MNTTLELNSTLDLNSTLHLNSTNDLLNVPNNENLYIFSYYLILQFVVYYFIGLMDNLLCKYYSDKARWFQIHSLINLFVSGYSKTLKVIPQRSIIGPLIWLLVRQ